MLKELMLESTSINESILIDLFKKKHKGKSGVEIVESFGEKEKNAYLSMFENLDNKDKVVNILELFNNSIVSKVGRLFKKFAKKRPWYNEVELKINSYNQSIVNIKITNTKFMPLNPLYWGVPSYERNNKKRSDESKIAYNLTDLGYDDCYNAKLNSILADIHEFGKTLEAPSQNDSWSDIDNVILCGVSFSFKDTLIDEFDLNNYYKSFPNGITEDDLTKEEKDLMDVKKHYKVLKKPTKLKL